MARVFIEGFESGSGALKDWVALDGATVVSSSGLSMSGSYCLDVSQSNRRAAYPLKTNYSELYVAFKFRRNTGAGYADNDLGLFNFVDSNGVVILTVGFNYSTLHLNARLGSFTGNTLVTGTTSVIFGQTYLLEVYYKPLNSGGVITVKLDGVEEYTFTGDVTGGAEADIKQLAWGCQGNVYAVAYGRFYIDDIVVDDANWIGDTRIQAVAVTGAGTTNQWDPSAATNKECVDEIPYSDTDYISTNVVNEVDTFAMADLTGAIISIKSVQVEARIAYEGAPTPTHVRLGCRSGGADHFDTDISPGVDFQIKRQMIELNPDGDIPWTESSVNAAEFGVKATA